MCQIGLIVNSANYSISIAHRFGALENVHLRMRCGKCDNNQLSIECAHEKYAIKMNLTIEMKMSSSPGKRYIHSWWSRLQLRSVCVFVICLSQHEWCRFFKIFLGSHTHAHYGNIRNQSRWCATPHRFWREQAATNSSHIKKHLTMQQFETKTHRHCVTQCVCMADTNF